jgi:DNA-binding response OmpR family regulator
MPRILIIDDDETMRGLLRARLEDAYHIIDTGEPEQAIGLTLQSEPDAILLELMMPNFSGFEVCQKLFALCLAQQIPIFIISGETAKTCKEFGLNLGSARYFEKPVDFDQLRAGLAAELQDNRPERRTEAPIRLNVILKLRGKDKYGAPFELFTTTENVSLNGFECSCTAVLEQGAMVDVFLCRDGEPYAGMARAVRAEWRDASNPLYGFRFVGKPAEWVFP